MEILTPYVIFEIVHIFICSTNTYFESENRQNIFSTNVDMHKQISAPPAPPQIQLSLLSNLSQGIVLCWEQSLQKSSESESSVMVVGKFEWTTYMPYGGGRNNTDA